MPAAPKPPVPVVASRQSVRSKPSTRQGLPTIPNVDNPEKARTRWRKTANRSLGIPRLPQIVEEEQRRHTQARIEEEERRARSEYDKIFLQLPRIHASYANSTDYFTQFLEEKSLDTADLEKFLRFCEVHGDFERRRKLYYALCARQLVKQKQIDLLVSDTKSYEAASELADKLLAQKAEGTASTSQAIFDELVSNFAQKCFSLCSLKSKEQYMRIKRSVNAKARFEMASQHSDSISWEIRREKIFIAVLDERLHQRLRKNYHAK